MNCDNCNKEVGLHIHVIPLKLEGYDGVVFCSDNCMLYWARRNKIV